MFCANRFSTQTLSVRVRFPDSLARHHHKITKNSNDRRAKPLHPHGFGIDAYQVSVGPPTLPSLTLLKETLLQISISSGITVFYGELEAAACTPADCGVY